jgi:bifunctional non-homologous end joining protein LigD
MSETSSDVRRYGRYRVEISRPDKVLFPDDGLTKRELCDYYARVADVMLPHLQGRPLTMHRFPDGIGEEGFYQKSLPEHYPDWMRRATVHRKGEGDTIQQPLLENRASLVFCADQAMITAHTALARVPSLQSPDRLVFDLDPPDDDGFSAVRQAAEDLHDLLEELELPSFLMTTGSRGMHVAIPLVGQKNYETPAQVAGEVAELLSSRRPDIYTTEFRKEARRGRLFLDTRRNYYGQTSVAPYSVRALKGAPVATPLRWRELRDERLHARRYTMKNLFRRLGQIEDPWSRIRESASGLEKARRRLKKLARSSD